MNILPFELDGGIGTRANLGLIVLQSDQTLEMEARRFLSAPGVAVYHSRIPCAEEVTADNLKGMRNDLTEAAGLLVPAIEFDVIGYGCTSASALLGADTVGVLVCERQPNAKVTNPTAAVKAALSALGAKKIGILTPYTEAVTQGVCDSMQASGFEIATLASFNESNDSNVARISEQSIAEAIRQTAGAADCDAIFVSCTSLRVAEVIEAAERELGIPVVSSNQAMCWHMLRLAGVDDVGMNAGFGRLWEL